jgi:hypothetical protein
MIPFAASGTAIGWAMLLLVEATAPVAIMKSPVAAILDAAPVIALLFSVFLLPNKKVTAPKKVSCRLCHYCTATAFFLLALALLLLLLNDIAVNHRLCFTFLACRSSFVK